MKSSDVDYADVQGLVRFGYGKMKGAAYALLHVKNAAAARAWLRAAPVTNAVAMKPPPTAALQVAFTADGLRALDVSETVVTQFSPEFLTGMTEEGRTRRLGDVEANAPAKWEWGYASSIPHVMVMFFAECDGFDNFVEGAKGNAWNEAFTEVQYLRTADLDGIEPFGFADGISQPKIDWERRRDVTRPQLDYSNIVALGEILLGYPNEYQKYNDRPLLDADAASRGLLAAEDRPDKKDLGRNGTYLVMRTLEQDVRLFWQFVSEQSGGNPDEAERLAAAFVGRTRAGDPLVPPQKHAIPGIDHTDPEQVRHNQFTFAKDPAGARCPFGAHVHRANPRNTDYPGRPTGLAKLITMLGFGPKGFRDDLMSSVRFHRVLRRGREYGTELKPEDALTPAPPNESERGLHFICLNANISRQFEFLQNAWMMNTKFSGLTDESDPLLGNRAAMPGCPVTGHFTMPEENGGVPRRVSGLPQFVTVRGGAYFFLPSLRALRYFAGSEGVQE